MDIAFTVVLLVLLWVAAVAFGRDSREGGDWRSGTDPGGRGSRPWD